MSYARQPNIPESPSHFEQLRAMLDAGTDLGPGYEFENSTIEFTGQEIDNLRFCVQGLINIDIRQCVNQRQGFIGPLRKESINTRPEPFSKDILVTLLSMHPAVTFGMQHTDGHRWSTSKSSWRFPPEGGMNFNMVDTGSREHGPISLNTKLSQLELVLGGLTVVDTIPEHSYIDLHYDQA